MDFAAALRRVGYSFSVALAPKISQEQSGLLYTAHDYGAVGSIADKVIIMTYEWGYTYGEPMAVAPIDKVRRCWTSSYGDASGKDTDGHGKLRL